MALDRPIFNSVHLRDEILLELKSAASTSDREHLLSIRRVALTRVRKALSCYRRKQEIEKETPSPLTQVITTVMSIPLAKFETIIRKLQAVENDLTASRLQGRE